MTNDSASALIKDDIIDDNLLWSNVNEVYIQYMGYDYGGAMGNWTDIDEAFLGLRLKINDEYHYSWLRLHFNNEYPTDMIAVDYAFNESANNAITASESLPAGATSVFAADKDDFFDGRDIRVSFTKAFYETILFEYRIILAKADDTTAYDLEFMNALSSEKYLSVLVDEISPFIRGINLTEETVDIDGDLVGKFVDYRIHILNVAASRNPEDNTLSTCSEVFNLQAYTQKVDDLSAVDIDNTYSAEDIQVSFTAIEKESFLSEYRIFIATLNDSDLDVETALSLSNDYYTRVLPSDSLIITTLHAKQIDINGNQVAAHTLYQIYILSVADSVYSISSAISPASRRFALNDPNCLTAGQKTGNALQSFECDSLFCEFPYWTGENDYGEGEVYIDLNRDGILDFYLYGKDDGGLMYNMHHLFLVGERNNMVLICNHEEHENWIDALKEHDAIGDNYDWYADTALLIDYYANYYDGTTDYEGHLPSNYQFTEYYIGFFIFDQNNNIQYAWLKMKGNEFIEYGFQDVIGGINTHISQNNFNVFPNPASDFIHIQLSDASSLLKNNTVSIINSLGILIDEFSLTNRSVSKNISTYPTGLYFFVIKNADGILERHKVIVN
jgi:hypothetical protein